MDIQGVELPSKEDSRSLAMLRARGDRLLAQCVRTCGLVSHSEFSLSLIDNPWVCDVLIDETLEKSASTKQGNDIASGFSIKTTPRWLEESADGEIVAVFAHELAHAIHGDCRQGAIDRWYASGMMSLVLAFAVALLSCVLLASGAMPPATRFHYMEVSLACVLYWLGCSLYWHHHRRKTEYRADAFSARHGFGEGLLVDLKREWMKEKRIWYKWPLYAFCTHPSFPHRQRAISRLMNAQG